MLFSVPLFKNDFKTYEIAGQFKKLTMILQGPTAETGTTIKDMVLMEIL